MSFVESTKRFYGGIIKIGNGFSHILLLAIRLFWGGSFFITGLGKLMNIESVAEFFKSLQLPIPTFHAYLVGGIELVCGALLVLGLFSRLASIPLIITMIVAYLTTELDAVREILVNPDLAIMKQPFNFLMASLIVFAFGPGVFSIGYWFEPRKR